MVDANTLLAKVLAAPDDDTPRLAWADAVEAEDPARAELVRVQCSLERLPDETTLIHRERQLLAANQGRWLRAHRPSVVHGTFRRGFLDYARVKIKSLVSAPEQLIGVTPLRSIYARDFTNKVAADASRYDWLRGIHTLSLHEGKLTGKGIASLVASPYLESLRELSLQYNRLGPDAIRALVGWPGLKHLESLTLSNNPLMHTHLIPLLSANQLADLRRLDVGGVLTGLDGMVTLANNLAIPNLHSLSIGGHDTVASDLRVLENCAALAPLRQLSLSGAIGGFGGLVLSTGPWKHLEELQLGDHASTPALKELVEGKWPELRSFGYHSNSLTAAAVATFCRRAWPALRQLRLGKLDARMAQELADSDVRMRLTQLSVALVDPSVFSRLLAVPWPELRVLHAGFVELDLASHEQLARTENLPKVHTLQVRLADKSKEAKAVRRRWGSAIVE